ncbi:hypothetical protein F7725_012417 [Dissostichus mawsoni]|uniref:Uncharacterized protein n=1 Tax=Dissostichus mawsoni TaxID=36200 RepID=A0A7J5YMA3_DISMA|nr:hypothetical protein F7725_012417 [Dissostichus mawsoni]
MTSPGVERVLQRLSAPHRCVFLDFGKRMRPVVLSPPWRRRGGCFSLSLGGHCIPNHCSWSAHCAASLSLPSRSPSSPLPSMSSPSSSTVASVGLSSFSIFCIPSRDFWSLGLGVVWPLSEGFVQQSFSFLLRHGVLQAHGGQDGERLSRGSFEQQRLHAVTVQLDGLRPQVQSSGVTLTVEAVTTGPQGTHGKGLEKLVDECVRFDPNGQPFQVGDALNHIHRHGGHLGSFHREREETCRRRRERTILHQLLGFITTKTWLCDFDSP